MEAQPYTQVPSLYYWQREKKGSQAEVDYVFELCIKFVPIEVKSGIKGKMTRFFFLIIRTHYTVFFRGSEHSHLFFHHSL